MASQLTGLFRTLTWADFGTPKKGSPPGPGHSATAAETFSSANPGSFSFSPIAGSKPAQFQLVDNITVAVSFVKTKSFVMNWVFSKPTQFQNDLLHHEQGHYNITALLARDFFVDVMLLKSQTFATAQAGITAVQAINARTIGKMGVIQKLYDTEVHPEQDKGLSKGPIQVAWDGFLQTAFTQARASGTAAPDGTKHKTPLVDVLTKAGKKI